MPRGYGEEPSSGTRGGSGQRQRNDDDLMDRNSSATATAHRGSKQRGKQAKTHGDDEAELFDKVGQARASRSCATVANSGETTDLACIAP